MLAAVVREADPFFVQALRLIAFDSYQRLAPQPCDPDLPVRVVDIDPESIARFGQWPWPRTVMRDLVVRLTKRNAAAVTFDILFAEPDRTSLEEVVKHLPPDQANRLPGMAGFPTNDELFAEALKRRRVRSFSLGPARPVCLTCGRHPSTLPCPVSRFRRRSLKTTLLDAGSRVPTML